MKEAKMTGLSHIGIYTKDMDSAIDFYKRLGFTLDAECKPDVRLAFLSLGSCIIELIENDKEWPVEGLIPHIAIECENIDDLVDNLKQRGFIKEDVSVCFNPGILGGVKNIFFDGPSGERLELFDNMK